MSNKPSFETIVYEISDLDRSGVLVDVLGKILDELASKGPMGLQWTVFDLDWLQRPDGILHWERVTELSSRRPSGWQLDEHGIRLFQKQCVQIIDGLFVASPVAVEWLKSTTAEALIPQVQIWLEACDSTLWRMSCKDEELAQRVVADFKHVSRTIL